MPPRCSAMEADGVGPRSSVTGFSLCQRADELGNESGALAFSRPSAYPKALAAIN